MPETVFDQTDPEFLCYYANCHGPGPMQRRLRQAAYRTKRLLELRDAVEALTDPEGIVHGSISPGPELDDLNDALAAARLDPAEDLPCCQHREEADGA